MLKSMTNTNSLSSWTKGKMTNLLLLSLSSLAIKGVNGGQAFENCLNYYSHPYYNALLNYPFSSETSINNNQTLFLCCNADSCVSDTSLCSTYSVVYITKVAQTIACKSDCVGIVGNTNITSNTTIGSDCPSDIGTIIARVASYISSLSISSLDGLEQGYAWWECPVSTPCQYFSIFQQFLVQLLLFFTPLLLLPLIILLS